MVLNAIAALQRKRIAGGGGWVPTDEGTDLVRWIKADNLGGGLSNNDPISTAGDSSGNGNTLTAAGSDRPTYKTNVQNSLPGMLFNTGAISVALSGSALTSSAKTAIIVFQADSWSLSFLGTKSGLSSNYYNFGGASYMTEFRSSRIDTYPASVPTTGVHVRIIVSSGATFRVWDDDTDAGAQTAAFDAGNELILGNNGNIAGSANSHIFEYIEINTDVGLTKHTQITDYCNAKWGL